MMIMILNLHSMANCRAGFATGKHIDRSVIFLMRDNFYFAWICASRIPEKGKRILC